MLHNAAFVPIYEAIAAWWAADDGEAGANRLSLLACEQEYDAAIQQAIEALERLRQGCEEAMQILRNAAQRPCEGASDA